MKVINSKNTWYMIFGLLFITIVTILVFNLIFKRTEEKLKDSSQRETLITQKDTKSSGPTYIKASPLPSPSPKPSKKPFFTLFNTPTTSPTDKPLISPTPNVKDTQIEAETVIGKVEIDRQITKGGQIASQSGDLEVITNEDGTTYLSTKNDDGTNDTYVKKYQSSLFEKIIPPTGYAQDIGEYINKLLQLVLTISTLLVFGQLIIGGLQWITSGGDKGKIEEARNKLVAAVIGLIIVASSFAILQLVLSFIGYQSINELMNLL